jgi:hypothetical protein
MIHNRIFLVKLSLTRSASMRACIMVVCSCSGYLLATSHCEEEDVISRKPIYQPTDSRELNSRTGRETRCRVDAANHCRMRARGGYSAVLYTKMLLRIKMLIGGDRSTQQTVIGTSFVWRNVARAKRHDSCSHVSTLSASRIADSFFRIGSAKGPMNIANAGHT